MNPNFTLTLYCILLFCLFNVNSQNSPLQLKYERGFPKSISTSKNLEAIPSSSIAPRYRLPKTVVPVHYRLQLVPILDEIPSDTSQNYTEFTAPGNVVIQVNCVEPGNKITLHKSSILTIDEDNVFVKQLPSGRGIPIDFQEDEVDKDFHHIIFTEFLEVGLRYEINIQFIAQIGDGIDRLDGLYSSFYTRPGSDEKIYLATTQMQSVMARKMFPCFDEPQFKTPFLISIGRKVSHTALANSERDSTTDLPENPGWELDIFKETVPMPTYLLAIVVSDFTSIDAPEGIYRVPVKVFGAPHLIEQGGGNYSAETSAKQMAFFERHFGGIEYPMHKMDSIAVPHFAAGAMENWGLNIYRPVYLLHFEGETERSRGLISNILAHELAHQWFGNLVTMEWWSGIWLNEGFATYWSYIGWNETHPEFEPLKFFINDAFQYSMQVDADPSSTHPVLNDALSPDEIEATFDGISYEKAASLIRMVEGFLGAEILRQASIPYLVDKANKAVSQDDLFLYLNYKAQEHNLLPDDGSSIRDVMNTWTLQSSFPLVRVSKFGDNRIMLSQERFSQSKFRLENILDKSNLWFIPVALATQNAPDFSDHKPKFWIQPSDGSQFYSHNTSEWILLNPDAMGYYRVLYDIPLTQLILQQLQDDHLVISSLSRTQLMDDYLNFGLQQYISIERALEMTKYLSKEKERIVWEAVLGNLGDMLSRLRDSPAYDEFRRYLTPKLESVLSAIGIKQLPEDKGAIVLFRALLLDWACQMNLPECNEYAKELFDDWKTSSDLETIPIPADIRPIVYCAAVGDTIDGADNFQFMWTRYENSTDEEIKLSFLNSLGCGSEANLLQSVLEEILVFPPATSRIDEAHKARALQLVARSNSLGRGLTLNFLRRETYLLLNLFADTDNFFNAVVATSSGMATSAELSDFESFILEMQNDSSLPLPAGLLDQIRDLLPHIETNIAWRAENEKRLQLWFVENV
jgi:aminopeptidase N